MKKVTISFVAIIIALITFSSCSQRLIDFTVISSKNVSLKIDKTQGKQVSATSMGFLGLGISIKDAMDKALQSAGPDYDLLLDGVVRVSNYFLVSGYKVEGTAISTSKLKASLGVKGYEEWCKANNVFDPSTATVQN
jgi:hypothetical protein